MSTLTTSEALARTHSVRRLVIIGLIVALIAAGGVVAALAISDNNSATPQSHSPSAAPVASQLQNYAPDYFGNRHPSVQPAAGQVTHANGLPATYERQTPGQRP